MVDIIVPIYNAYEDLTKCVSSVWRHTDLRKNRLILVNDKSTDERIVPYLKRVAGGNVIVHNSKENGGFSASVNIGMKYSEEHDVILLNSDTIVTAGWVDKLVECAYSEDSIATVTPLSNSATIASIPIQGQDNIVPSNVTIDEYANIVEKCSFKDYPQITVAVGFCMYIKRKVIRDIGYFDVETFGRGYGEENDFCCRCEIAGYKHVLCDNTFIYHKGTASFVSEQKKALMEAHLRVLEDRYPASMRNNHIFCMSGPFQYIRDNIANYVQLRNGKKNILYILHSDFRAEASDNVGGTQLHVKDLKDKLIDRYNFYVLAKDGNQYRLSCYVDDALYTYEFMDENVSVYPRFYDAGIERMLRNILSAFRIELIHVHHISNMSLDIYMLADEMKIPVITTIHDFYTVCPTYFLYNLQERNCGGVRDESCRTCIEKRAGIWGGSTEYLSKWRREMQQVLGTNKLLLFPSQSAKAIFESVYDNDVPGRVIYHGIDKYEAETDFVENYIEDEERVRYSIDELNLSESNCIHGWAYRQGVESQKTKVIVQLLQEGRVVQQITAVKQGRQDVDFACGGNGMYEKCGFQARVIKNQLVGDKADVRILLENETECVLVTTMQEIPVKQEKVGNGVRVAFIGGMSDIKGSRVACDMVKKAPDIEWFVFGNIAPGEELGSLDVPNLHKFGAYNRNDIGVLLTVNQIDVVCIMSVCPETFCYTLSEAWETKVPVLVYDNGAVGERVKQTGAGIVVSPDESTANILQKLQDVASGEEWEKARKCLEGYQHKTTAQMAEEYVEVYESLLGTQILSGNWEPEFIYHAYRGKK